MCVTTYLSKCLLVQEQLKSLYWLSSYCKWVIRHVQLVVSVCRTDRRSGGVFERVQSFHLHNNEVGSEAIGSICLPPNCAHVLMDSVLHYFADPGLNYKEQSQKHESMCVCLSLFVRLPDGNSSYLKLSKLKVGFTNNSVPTCQNEKECIKLIHNYSFTIYTFLGVFSQLRGSMAMSVHRCCLKYLNSHQMDCHEVWYTHS